MSRLFDPASKEDNAYLLAAHLPTGAAWKKAFDIGDPFGKFIYALGIEFYRFQVLEQTFYREMNPEFAGELLPEWEASVGIPNPCFKDTGTISERRTQVQQVFSKFGGVQKNEDFVRVAQVFGIAIEVQSGKAEGSIVDPKVRAHTLFIDILFSVFPLDQYPIPFPLPFRTSAVDFLRCIFEALAPANVQLIFSSSTQDNTVFSSEDGDAFITESGSDFFIPE